MTDAQYFEVIPTRRVDGANFPLGVQEYSFSVGVPNVWHPHKSYFRVGMTLYGAPLAGPAVDQPTVREMVAFADNAVGNMFDNAYVRSNNVEISSIAQGLAQASALNARIGKGYSWLKSLGSGASLNKAKFPERVMLTASGTPADAYLNASNEMYRPVTSATFLTAQVDITELEGTAAVADPLSVAFPLVQNGGIVTCATGLFTTGMPNATTGAPTGASVAVGDVLVADGVNYPITQIISATSLEVSNVPSSAVAGTADWYIVRKDVMRAPQAGNQIFSLWQPPLGLFNYEDGLGSGEFRIQLNPNSSYVLTAAETKNPAFVASSDGLTGTYSLVVNEVKFYAYIEKMRIPDQVQDLSLMEYQVQSKPWANNLQFSISPYTAALSIFVQDVTAGNSPLVPPSMFKCLDNSDLMLSTMQVSYAGITKPSTPWLSSFYGGADKLQQRYHDTYEETGMMLKSSGAETYEDWLQRGPIYHYSFVRDASNRSTEVQVTTTFASLTNGPGTGTGGTGLARVYCVSHFARNVQVTTAAGAIVQVTSRS